MNKMQLMQTQKKTICLTIGPEAPFSMLGPTETPTPLQEPGEMDRLPSLLSSLGQSLCDGNPARVLRCCEELTGFAMATKVKGLDISQDRMSHVSLRCVFDVLEARAFCRSALQRWRRTLTLRRRERGANEDEGYYGSRALEVWRV